MNPDTGEMGFVNPELLKEVKEREAVSPAFKNIFKTQEEMEKAGFTVPFEVGEAIEIKGCKFVVNNFVPEYSFMNLKLVPK